MTISGVTQLGITSAVTGLSTSNNGPSVSYTAGRQYIVCVIQSRGSSLNPDTPTLTGLGVTSWGSPVYDSQGPFTASTQRRRMTIFFGEAGSTGTGVPTMSVSNTPSMVAWSIVEAQGCAGVNATFDGSGTIAATSLAEYPTISGWMDADSRPLVFAHGNTSPSAANIRLELSTDSGGDADWTSFTAISSVSTVARYLVGGWRNSQSDTTPGIYNASTTTPTSHVVALELEAAGSPPAGISGFWGIAATVAAVLAVGFGGGQFGSVPFGAS